MDFTFLKSKLETVVQQTKTFIQANKRTVLIVVCFIIAVSAVVGITAYRNNNRWKHELDVKYMGRTEITSDIYYYEYTITNRSGRTLNNVAAIFCVDNPYGDFEFDQMVGTLRIGETTTVKLYWNTVLAEAARRNIELCLASVDILRIIYD